MADHEPTATGLVRPDQETLAETTKYLVGASEWAVPAYLASSLIYSLVYDPYTLVGRCVIIALVLVHVALVRPFRNGLGPFYRGGPWPFVAIGVAFAVNAVVAATSTPGTYGNNKLGIPCGMYQSGVVLFIAFCPWLSPRLARYRRLIEAGIILLLVVEWLVLVRLANGQITLLNLRAVGMIALVVVTAYLLGLAVGQMCVAAVKRQMKIQQDAFDRFFDFLHSRVKGNIASVRTMVRGNAPAIEALRTLDDAVSHYRVELLLSRDRVPLATLLSEQIRAFTGSFVVGKTPQVGGVTVPPSVGHLISWALGDLLSNAVKHGALRVDVDLAFTGGTLVLTIADDGPGFPATVLEQQGTSLKRLHDAALRLAGDLAKVETGGRGSTLLLTLPIEHKAAA